MRRGFLTLVTTLAVVGMLTSCSGEDQDDRPTQPTAASQAAAPRAVCDGVVPGQAAARLVGSNNVIDQGMVSNDLEDNTAKFSCSIYSQERVSVDPDPNTVVQLDTLRNFNEESPGGLEEYNLDAVIGRPIRSTSTNLGPTKIGPRGGLFLPVCNEVSYYLLVTSDSDDGTNRYDAVRAIGVAVEKALEEAQDCREDGNGGGGAKATPSAG